MKNKSIYAVISVVIALIMVSTSVLCASAVQGRNLDLDDMEDFVGEEPDAEFTAKDANILKRVIAGDLVISDGTEEFDRFDVNGDWELNAKDANIIKRAIAGEIVL